MANNPVVVVTGDPLWQSVGISIVGTLGALFVAYVIYRFTRKDEDKRLTKVLQDERTQRQEERTFLALQEIRTALAELGPVLAQRNAPRFIRDPAPPIPEMIERLQQVVHLQHVHLHGPDRDACGRLSAVTTDWRKATPGEEWRTWTNDLNDFLDGAARYFTARIKGEVASMPSKPSWSQ
ncbi:MAG: hypothetical protein ACXVXT_05195 [Blastococcus sp.]